MEWSKYDNVSSASKWLKRKVELIEEKDCLLISQYKKVQALHHSVPIKEIYRGGIFHAELGYGNIGGEKDKTRPVLVISPNRLNKGNTVVVAPLSTKFKRKQNGLPLYNNHYLLTKRKYPELDKDSVVKFEDIRSIDVVRLRDVVCNVDRQDMRRMKRNLLFMCGY